MDRLGDIINRLETAYKLSDKLLEMFTKVAKSEDPISDQDSREIRVMFNQLYGCNQSLRYSFDDIRNCSCCGRPFIIVGTPTDYCDRVREKDGLTCKEYAKKRQMRNLPRPRKGEFKNGKT